jgi:hypothetical protein
MLTDITAIEKIVGVANPGRSRLSGGSYLEEIRHE